MTLARVRALRLPARVAALLSLALALTPALHAAGAQSTRAPRRAPARARKTAARANVAAATPRPTPVRVPQLAPAQNQIDAAAVTPPAQQPAQTPQPVATPAPQEAKPADAIEDDEIITVTSNLVVVPVSVTDAAGQPVQGLKAADFRLEEEGRAQEVADVGAAEQVPLDIALVFDVSSSITAKRFFEFQRQSAVNFLKQVLKPADRAAVFTISNAPLLVQELAPAEVATAKVRAIPPATVATATAFYDTVALAAKYLAAKAPGNHRRVILVVSDGEDNNSDLLRDLPVADMRAEAEAISSGKLAPSGARKRVLERHRRAVEDVKREVQRADVVFYAINPSGPGVRLNDISLRAQEAMQAVADSTGGTAHLPARAEDLETIFRQIASELRAQYLIQYYSNSDAPAGKFLRIKVNTPARADARVRARQGYYSKKR
ncbi:MAG: VWA domain-containing protein [Acidobacteria bacterium]|nr:VWA domain-containing protein [Acidobacteriota bacterium]